MASFGIVTQPSPLASWKVERDRNNKNPEWIHNFRIPRVVLKKKTIRRKGLSSKLRFLGQALGQKSTSSKAASTHLFLQDCTNVNLKIRSVELKMTHF